MRVPAGPPVATERTRLVEAALNGNGLIEGSFVETLTGESRSEQVSFYRSRTKPDYIKSIERWVGRSINGARTSDVEVDDGDAAFVLKARFSSPTYIRRPQARMMILPSVGRKESQVSGRHGCRRPRRNRPPSPAGGFQS